MKAINIKGVTKTNNYEFEYNSTKGSFRRVYKVNPDNVQCTLDMIFIHYDLELTDSLIKLLLTQDDLRANIIMHEFNHNGKVMLSNITRYVKDLKIGGENED